MRRITRMLVIAAIVVSGCSTIEENSQPSCSSLAPLRLMVSAVPTARYVPCVRSMPAGWSFEQMQIENRHVDFAISSDESLVEVVLSQTCKTAGYVRRTTSDSTVDVYGLSSWDGVQYRADTLKVFDGGCARYVLSAPKKLSQSVATALFDGIELRDAESLKPGGGDQL